MKKINFLLLILCVFIFFATPVCAGFENPPIVDNAEYLTDSQFEELSEKFDEIRKKYDFDVAVYTEKYMSGSDVQNSADDIFDYNGYGSGSNKNGMIFYISADSRKYHIFTHGSGEIIFNDNGIAYIEKNILPSLKKDDYYTAFKHFAEHTDELLEMAENGEPFNEKQLSLGYVCGVVGCALILPLILAYAMMKKKLKKMKTAVENNYAANYMKPGSLNLALSRDIFLYSTVTKTEKPKANSGSHTSSSGESHGGHGGSF